MNRLEYLLSVTVLRICSVVFSLLPIDKDKVVFASARSDRLRGNLRFIHREMQRTWGEKNYVFLLQRYSYGFAGKLRYMLSLIRGQYHLATTPLCILDNAYLPVHVRPHRARTTVIQVWHAAGALKKFGVDVSPESRKTESRFLHKYYDWVVVGSDAAIAPYASALRTPESHVAPLGVARTDFFFAENEMAAERERLFGKYPALRGRKIVLYAPTFRGYGRDKHEVDALDAEALRARLPEEWALVYKIHPVLEARGVSVSGFDEVLDPGLGINGVLAATDILITDYSSSVFEYALLRRPLVLFAPDLEEYRTDPGFYLDYPGELIGEYAGSTEEVAEIIESGRFDLSAYDAFIAKHMQYADGGASRRFVEFVSEL